MKMKCKELLRTNMSYRGSKILKSIMDNATPGIDLFVREIIQNCNDAILQDKKYGIIEFNYGKFDSTTFNKSIDRINDALSNKYRKKDSYYLSISDKNTTGLLGGYTESLVGPNNLYNLVYDFMNGKENLNAGGSWGIGKSVYYRYGTGLCFYYTRTFENSKYVHKLVGALIENETKPNALLGVNGSGIAFFGSKEHFFASKENVIPPIMDEREISEFLSIFNLKPYTNDETGTIVIIPYLNDEELLANTINNGNGKYWKDDVVESLKVSIQRWYFPKINNEKYPGKYLKIAVNGEMLFLNDFYNTLQKLYNEEIDDAVYMEILPAKGMTQVHLGKLKFKKFTNDELGIETPPNNLPNPYVLLDIDKNDGEKNKPIFFYLRKPGMIITYDHSLGVDDLETNEGEYFIGMFVLNDEYVDKNENLGQYIRQNEKGNHKYWQDGVVESMPNLTWKRPIRKIMDSTKKIIKSTLSIEEKIVVETATSALQKKLGKKLLPPDDFGKRPSIATRNKQVEGERIRPTSNKVNIYFEGFHNGRLVHYFDLYIFPNQTLTIDMNIATNNKTYSVEEWHNLKFMLPCILEKVYINKCVCDRKNILSNYEIHLYENQKTLVSLNDSNIFEVWSESFVDENNYGIKIKSLYKEKLTLRVETILQPKDLTNNVSFNAQLKSIEVKRDE